MTPSPSTDPLNTKARSRSADCAMLAIEITDRATLTTDRPRLPCKAAFFRTALAVAVFVFFAAAARARIVSLRLFVAKLIGAL